MNFLYIRAKKSFLDIPMTLLEMGHHVDIFEACEFDPNRNIPEANEAFRKMLRSSTYDFVISYIFLPQISAICEELSTDYISWTYDSPLASLYNANIYNKHNYTFIFDKTEYEHLKENPIPHLYYLPMGANISRIGALDITPEDEQTYSCDISFVGNLYENNSYNNLIHLIPEHLALELKTYLMQNLCNWNTVKPWPRTSPAVTQYLIENLDGDKCTTHGMDNDIFLGQIFLARKLAEMDRLTVLNALAERYRVDLYTASQSPFLGNIYVHGTVNYYTEMTKVFYLSKINLNITLPSIQTGLPQRIFDIMASGGFVLTNYQKEIEDMFEIGKEIEVFYDLEDLLTKTDYYLTHEKERITIAMKGYMKVRDYHTYQHRIQKILDTITHEKQSEQEES